MNEIEIKVRINNPEKIKQSLLELGCNFSEELVQKDRIYLPQGVTFTNKKQGDLFFRIRNSNNTHILTLKKQLNTESENIEHEIIIDNPEQAHHMIKLLNFNEVLTVEKKRITCSYNDISICIDEVKDLGIFIEFEKTSHSQDIAQIKSELIEFLKSLELSENDIETKGYATQIYELQLNQ